MATPQLEQCKKFFKTALNYTRKTPCCGTQHKQALPKWHADCAQKALLNQAGAIKMAEAVRQH